MSSTSKILAKLPGRPPAKDMVWIPGGTFLMESDHHYAEESLTHLVVVDGFWMDKYLVTNSLQKFIKASRGAVVNPQEGNAIDLCNL